METSHVKPFDVKLKWSEPTQGGESVDVLAACPNENEFYFVSVDYDSVWAGLIIGKDARSYEVDTQEAGKEMCQIDFERRLKASYQNSVFNNAFK